MIETKFYEDCKIVTNQPKYWDPLHKLLNQMLGEEFNRLVMADDLAKIKECQGTIKTLRRLIDLPNEVSRREGNTLP